MWLLFDGSEDEATQIHAEAGEEEKKKAAAAGAAGGEKKALAEVIGEKSAEVQGEWMKGKKYQRASISHVLLCFLLGFLSPTSHLTSSSLLPPSDK